MLRGSLAISQGVDAHAARVRVVAAYQDFLTLCKDPDVPALKEAKAEYAKRVLSSSDHPNRRCTADPPPLADATCSPIPLLPLYLP
jgi:hypothetical protein